jgi:hypothetical protein
LCDGGLTKVGEAAEGVAGDDVETAVLIEIGESDRLGPSSGGEIKLALRDDGVERAGAVAEEDRDGIVVGVGDDKVEESIGIHIAGGNGVGA